MPLPILQRPAVTPIQPDDALPAGTEVVVIGGGIIGVSAALHLARAGVPVVLCEKGEIAAEQSSRNWGWVRRMGRDPRELPLIVEAMKLWDGMSGLTGEDVGFRRSGILYVCDSEEDEARREDWLARAGDYALDTQMIGREELAHLLPAAKPWRSALYTPSDGRAEPQRAASAICRAAQRAGAKVFTQCAVRGIETEAGRVSGVVTERGAIRCRAAILAGGAWSGLFCRNTGLRLPQLTVRATVMRTAPADGLETAAWTPDFAFRKRMDGGYTIAHGNVNRVDIEPDSFRYFFDFLPILKIEGKNLDLRFGREFFEKWRLSHSWKMDGISPFEKVRILDPAPVAKTVENTYRAFRERFPSFRDVPLEQAWAGMIDATPDAVPVISPVMSLPGLVIATGFSGHGFGIGPGAGRLAAELATGVKTVVDPAPFRYERFIDGTKPRPTTGV